MELMDLLKILFVQDNVNLVAAGGYSTYKWSTDEAGNNVIGIKCVQMLRSQVLTTYIIMRYLVVLSNKIYSCSRFGGSIVNPTSFADEIVTCRIITRHLPKYFFYRC
jgi:hypothetical protein